MLTGSCGCGAIEYEIEGKFVNAVKYCHCWRCRKHSGSSFGTTAGVQASEFSVVSGRELLNFWESSPGIRRHFASCCGSPLYKTSNSNPEVVALRLGTLDTDPEVKVEKHFMVSSKAPWVEIRDELEQIIGDGSPFGSRDVDTKTS